MSKVQEGVDATIQVETKTYLPVKVTVNITVIKNKQRTDEEEDNTIPSNAVPGNAVHGNAVPGKVPDSKILNKEAATDRAGDLTPSLSNDGDDGASSDGTCTGSPGDNPTEDIKARSFDDIEANPSALSGPSTLSGVTEILENLSSDDFLDIEAKINSEGLVSTPVSYNVTSFNGVTLIADGLAVMDGGYKDDTDIDQV